MSASMAKLDNLFGPEKDVVLDWFLYHMSMDTREKLMATFPQHYALLFPGVDPQAVLNNVKDRLYINADSETKPLHERKSL